MKLVIRTQYMENYGAHDWDGEGQCPQYWKMKGGSEYMVEDVPLNIDYDEVIEMLGQEVNWDSEYSRSYVVEWSLENDDYMSEFERSQLEYEGRVTFAEPRVSYDEVLSKYADPYAYADEQADLDAIYYGA